MKTLEPKKHSSFCLRFLISLVCLLLMGCRSAEPVLSHRKRWDSSDSKRARLERKAAKGDADAAYRLHSYYFIAHGRDPAASETWLRRAAELDHPEAQEYLALSIKANCLPSGGFGASAPDAVKNLLARAARTDGDACYDLASAYAEGYFSGPDQAKARHYFEQGAALHNRRCWEKLSHYYRHGIGGPRNDAAAYYWISLEARCVHPLSESGVQTWATRKKIATHLSLPILEGEWKRIDDFMAQVAAKKVAVYFTPFLSGAIDPRVEAEDRRLAQQWEDEHRNKCRSKSS